MSGKISAPRLTLASIEILIEQLSVDDREQLIKSLNARNQKWKVILRIYDSYYGSYSYDTIGIVTANDEEEAAAKACEDEFVQFKYLNSYHEFDSYEYCAICDSSNLKLHDHCGNIPTDNISNIIKREFKLGRASIRTFCDKCIDSDNP